MQLSFLEYIFAEPTVSGTDDAFAALSFWMEARGASTDIESLLGADARVHVYFPLDDTS
jgi:hypothetical protein